MGEKATSFRALCDAFEAASEATRAEFLEWLDSDRVPSPWPATDDQLPWGGIRKPAGESNPEGHSSAPHQPNRIPGPKSGK